MTLTTGGAGAGIGAQDKGGLGALPVVPRQVGEDEHALTGTLPD
jgi:hypothetical protein